MGLDNRVGILVTGGAGFIGSHTVVELLDEDYTVVVIDNLSNSTSSMGGKKLPPVLDRICEIVTPKQGQNLHFFKGSFGDTSLLDEVFNKFSIYSVIHFGAFKAVGESKELPLMYYRNNVGAVPLPFIPSQAPKIYPSVKRVVSATVLVPMQDVCGASPEWKVISLRYFNPVGAHKSGKIGEDPKGTPNNLMPYIAQVAIGRREHLKVLGNDYPTRDGTGVRDYVHVVDIAKGHSAALKVLSEKNGFVVYNLGTGIGTSVMEMLKAFSEAVGRSLPYQICERRPGDVSEMYCDPSSAQSELSWTATRGVSEMCEDLWRFQSQNPNGYCCDE